jgi:hypothetical protein
MKYFLFVVIIFLFLGCKENDKSINPDNDFITSFHVDNYVWDDNLYKISNNLLKIGLSREYLNLTKEIIQNELPENLKSKKIGVEIGKMSNKMVSQNTIFYYLNSDFSTLDPHYVGFAYQFTKVNDNSIYYCKILMSK